MLDPKGLEAAAKAIRNDIWQPEPNPTTERYLADLRQQAIDQAEAAIRAYFSASIPADVESLVERLNESAMGHGNTEGSLRQRAASALRSQAQRIVELERVCTGPAAEAQLAKREAGEAVAWLREDTLTHVNGRKVLRLCSQYDRGAFPVYVDPDHTSGVVTEADLKRAYLMGREQWCPAGILSDTARTERDWQRTRAALRGDAS